MSPPEALRPATDSVAPVKSAARPSEIVEDALDIVQQGLSLLVDLNDRSYSKAQAAPFHASVGQHYRHVMEHFQCLIRGLPRNEINYDARERNVRLETEVSYASVSSCQLLADLKRLTDEVLESECIVIASAGYKSDNPHRLRSNGNRELAYCVGHAIHHYAIVKFICSDIGVSLPDGFGLAPSTLKHLSSTAAR